MKGGKTILQLFPQTLRKYMEETTEKYATLSEIRIRADRPVLIYRSNQEYYLDKRGREVLVCANLFTEALCLDAGQVEDIFVHLCRYSPYAYSEDLRQGFLTVTGGHRIGVAGQMVKTENGITGIRNVKSLNIRISHEIKGVADRVIPYVHDREGESVYSCLIVAPPGKGKTTMLRDMVRQISDGNNRIKGCTVAVVDERSEIAGCFLGEPQNDVGIRTDVLDACPKVHGMEMVLRSMAPKVIAVDEIATNQDVEALLLLMNCGIRVFATIHGEDMQEMKEKPFLRPLLESGYFKRFVVMCKMGEVKMYDEKGACLM